MGTGRESGGWRGHGEGEAGSCSLKDSRAGGRQKKREERKISGGALSCGVYPEACA